MMKLNNTKKRTCAGAQCLGALLRRAAVVWNATSCPGQTQRVVLPRHGQHGRRNASCNERRKLGSNWGDTEIKVMSN